MHEFTNKPIHGDHTFGLQLAERHMNRPLIRRGGAKAIARQIGALANAHAGVANQQKGVAAQIVAANQLLLQELILLCGERTWEPLGEAWNIRGADQMSEFRKLFHPSEFLENEAEMDEQVDTGSRRQWRCLRTQARHPAEDVITAQLTQRAHLGMNGAEIGQKVASSPTVVTSSVRMERSAARVDSTIKGGSQPMLEWGPSSAVHDEVTGSGRMC